MKHADIRIIRAAEELVAELTGLKVMKAREVAEQHLEKFKDEMVSAERGERIWRVFFAAAITYLGPGARNGPANEKAEKAKAAAEIADAQLAEWSKRWGKKL